jgi:diphthamide biosynthesis protein 3
MTAYHDEVEIEDFEYDEDSETYYYPCPCGDRFQITKVRPLFYPFACQ